MRAILTYHSIDQSGSPISVDPEVFAQHVQWFASGNVRVMSVEELLREPDESDAVALTFDDALETVASVALPSLVRHGLPATVFVVTDHVGCDNRWSMSGTHAPQLPVLGWSELTHLIAAGVAIGSHTKTHPDLRSLGQMQLEDEIRGSARTLESKLGVRPRLFAYPYGNVDARVASCVADLYPMACTSEFRLLRPGEEWSRLPRLDMYYFRRQGLLETWGSSRFAAYVRFRGVGRNLRRQLLR